MFGVNLIAKEVETCVDYNPLAGANGVYMVFTFLICMVFILGMLLKEIYERIG